MSRRRGRPSGLRGWFLSLKWIDQLEVLATVLGGAGVLYLGYLKETDPVAYETFWSQFHNVVTNKIVAHLLLAGFFIVAFLIILGVLITIKGLIEDAYHWIS